MVKSKNSKSSGAAPFPIPHLVVPMGKKTWRKGQKEIVNSFFQLHFQPGPGEHYCRGERAVNLCNLSDSCGSIRKEQDLMITNFFMLEARKAKYRPGNDDRSYF